MAKERQLEQRTEGRYVVALPLVDMGVPEYSRINHIGGSIATTSAGAVSQYVFRMIQHKITARSVLANLRDRYGGVGNYAMRIPENDNDDNGNPLSANDRRISEEIEVACYFGRCYGKNPRSYLDATRRILGEFERIRRKQKK